VIANAQKTTGTVRSLGTNDAGPGSRSRVFADSQQLSAQCAGSAIAMPTVPIYARQVAALIATKYRAASTVIMNGKVESCSNDQDESDVNQHPKDHCQVNPAATEFTAAIGASSNAAEAAKSLIRS
jgi:hypothetical protein